MCTVTIIPKGKQGFVLTSNRDEAPNRISLTPEFYTIEDVKVLFPKDKISGGTWIGISETNRVVCVLNGGFVLHERKPSYRKSRGIVANDLMICNDVVSMVETYNFEDIEPFTIVIADWNFGLKFYELVWDGKSKHFKELPLEPQIWSSSTLYTETMKKQRKQWFEQFKSQFELDADALMEFHKTAGAAYKDYGVVMNRGFVKTTSITQIEKQNDIVNMRFESIEDKVVINKVFNLPQVVNG
jgi:hypothetical protein